MLPMTIPGLRSPFPDRINPYVTPSFVQTQQWVRDFRLHEGAAFETYKAEGLSWMTARFYPSAAASRLMIADKFNTLLFALDDLMDHNDRKSAVISSRSSFEAFIEVCLQIMDGRAVPMSPTGHLTALADVWAQVRSLTTAEWQRRFATGIRQMFDAALWSHDNVAAGRLPTIAEFYRMRPFLGAANTSTDMIEFAEEVKLPDELLDHPTISELTRLCQITVCLANDLFSLSKELAHQDKHNMVVVIQHEKGLTVKQAIRETVRMHNADVAKFIKLSREIPPGGEYAPALKRYISCLTALMRGNIDWSRAETNRYNFVYRERGRSLRRKGVLQDLHSSR